MDDSSRPTASRARKWWALGALAACVALGCSGATAWAWSEASASDCAELPREDLELSEMADLHRKVVRHKLDPAQPVVLTAREASFLLREEFRTPAWVTLGTEGIEAEARVRRPGGCWNVRFVGSVEVEQGEATVVPRDLRVGDLRLGWLVGGWSFRILPEDVVIEGRGAELLQHLERMEVVGESIQVRVDDPDWIH